MVTMLLVPVCLGVLADGATVFPFDGAASTDTGLEPARAEGLVFVQGRDGQCLRLGPGARLSYPTQGAYDPSRGTVSLWVRPNWNSRDIRGDRLLLSLEEDPGYDNAVSLGVYGAEDRCIVYFSNSGGVDGAIAPIDWRAGEWHHVVACWDWELRCRALYVDGSLVGAARTRRAMPSEQSTFEVGFSRRVLPYGGHGGALCDIDDMTISTAVTPADFADAAAAVAATRSEQDQLESVRERLSEEFSLDRVAQEGIEVTWDDLVGLGAPMTKRVPISVGHHEQIVFAQPDLSVSLGTSDAALGLGVALGVPRRLPEVREPTHRLREGYLPIVESQWRAGAIVLEQTAFCVLADADEVVTGRETQHLRMRLTLRNEGSEPSRADLSLVLGRMAGTQNVNYGPFVGPASRWENTGIETRLEEDALMIGDRALLALRADDGIAVSPGDALLFTTELAPGEARDIDLAVTTAPELRPPEELRGALASSQDTALQRCDERCRRALARGMKLRTPEPRLNDIYRHIVLSALASTIQHPNQPWHTPYQNLFATSMVWPWEFSHMAAPLISIGYAEEMRPSLRFFTERQTGVGPHSANRGPDGDVINPHGCYTGTSMYWMCETGAVLWSLADNYLYSRDDAWLEAQRPSILAAWEYVQRERGRTRLHYDDGSRVEYYGLLPKGRVHDWDGHRYHYAFSDGVTWKGMTRMAAAFRAAGLPEAERMEADAREYGECILDVMRRAEFVDPETNLPFVPNTVFYREGVQGGLWWTDGPASLFSLGLLPPDDQRFEYMMAYLQRKWGTLMGLTNRMEGPRDTPFWYVNLNERGYYQNFLARGEPEKALLVLMSTLVYSLSHDCYQTVERIDITEPNYAPFQPNPSGNGRLIDMLKRMVVDEQDPTTLWFLRGCPRRWFEPGESVEVQDAPTLYGNVAVRSQATAEAITVEVTPPAIWPADGLRVVVRAPSRQPFASVTVNGRRATMDGDAVHITSPAEVLRVRFALSDGGGAP
ncbi:MAG: LamG-like jellyroll fold domain-containing protein [Armatimonadota bacterium]|jgi:hypothetical protein